VFPSKAALSHKKPASAESSCDNCRAHEQDKIGHPVFTKSHSIKLDALYSTNHTASNGTHCIYQITQRQMGHTVFNKSHSVKWDTCIFHIPDLFDISMSLSITLTYLNSILMLSLSMFVYEIRDYVD
jgi:hypothetical protein